MSNMNPEFVRLLLVLAATVSAHFFFRLLLKRLELASVHTSNIWDDALIEAARKPFPVLIWLVGLFFALQMLRGHVDGSLQEYLTPARNISMTLCLGWFLSKLIRQVGHNVIAQREKLTGIVDRTTIDGISKLLRITVAVITGLMVLQTLGVSISGILAFGGVGGIAVGFAARDLLANFFGGLMVHLDRPFNVGESIRSPDKQIDGKVEHIGWRQTQLRASNMNTVYVPNSLFTSIVVENTSRITNRRIQESIGLRYEDLGKVESIAAEIKAMLAAHPAIDAERDVIVAFDRFGDSSLDLTLLAFSRTTALPEFHAAKQDILLKIAAIVAGHGADFAFPTRTLHIVGGAAPAA